MSAEKGAASKRDNSRLSKFQKSAGGVVLRDLERSNDVCLIRRQRYKRETWCLPKGHLEPGEDSAEAAVREVLEETGIRARILQPLRSIRYQFKEPPDKTRYMKQVDFYLMVAEADAIEPSDTTEVMEARWFPLSEAMRKAAYDKERAVLRQAQRRIESRRRRSPA